jgi:hypothetical protein
MALELDIESLRVELGRDRVFSLELYLLSLHRPSYAENFSEEISLSLEKLNVKLHEEFYKEADEMLGKEYLEFDEDGDEDEGSQNHRRYRTMEAASMRLQKEAKGYLDSLRGW